MLKHEPIHGSDGNSTEKSAKFLRLAPAVGEEEEALSFFPQEKVLFYECGSQPEIAGEGIGAGEYE